MSNILTVIMNAVSDYLVLVSVITILLVCLAWAIIKLARIKTPAHLHMVWFLTLIAVVITPVLWLYGPKLPISIVPAENSFIGEILLQQVESNSEMSGEDFSLITLFFGKNIIVWLWCTGFIFLSIRFVISGYRLSHIITSSMPVADDILPDKFYTKNVKLLRTSRLGSPVCFGIIRPTILLPDRMYQNSSSEELRMIIRHEMAHIARKDCWINLFQRVVETLLFFHPLVWYASRQLTDQREQLCDNHVINDGASPQNYVKMLTRIAELCFERNEHHAVALFEGKLLTRVYSLLEPGNNNQTRASLRATVTGLLIMLLCLAACTIQMEAKKGTGSSNGSLPAVESQAQNKGLFSTAYKFEDLDERPTTLEGIRPFYPFAAMAGQLEGKVVVRFVIDKEGYPREPEILSAEPEGVFEEEALKSIKTYRYRPAVKDGKNVDCIAIRAMNFIPPK
ncbi:MAG: M56 family metallopeptidase [Desulfobacteraceae bacterium]